MDNPIDSTLGSLLHEEKNVTGILVTDKQGLCIKTIGNAKEESSGVISAISDLVAKLEPNKISPEILFESDTKCCLIHSGRNSNSAVFMNISH